MEKKKPLRESSDKLKDIYNTYVKNDPMDKKDKNKNKEDEEMNENAEMKDKENDENVDEEVESNESIDETEELEFKIDELENEVGSLKEKLLRKSAEMENLRRRTQKEKEDLVKYANEQLLLKLLDIPDDISSALDSAKSESDDNKSLLQGIEMIHNKVLKLFEEAGVKKMRDLEGKEFDVDYHEALLQQPSDEVPEGHIVTVIQPGYMLGDKVLRHAKVVTSSGSEESDEENSNEESNNKEENE